VVVGRPPVVVQVRREQVTRRDLDRVGEVAHQEGMPGVEADADVGGLHLVLDHRDQRGGVGERVRDHFERELHAEGPRGLVQRLETPEHGVAPVVARIRLLHVGHAQMDDQEARLEERGGAQGGQRLLDGQGAGRGVGGGQRIRGAPDALVQAVGDGRVHGVRPQAPLGQLRGQQGKHLGIVVVHVRFRGEHLHGLEPVVRDVIELIGTEAHVVIEVRGHAELHGHKQRV
jgi:hypothetical protein